MKLGEIEAKVKIDPMSAAYLCAALALAGVIIVVSIAIVKKL